METRDLQEPGNRQESPTEASGPPYDLLALPCLFSLASGGRSGGSTHLVGSVPSHWSIPPCSVFEPPQHLAQGPASS